MIEDSNGWDARTFKGVVMKSYNKYRNVKTIIDGIEFSSKAEGNRYIKLFYLQKAGGICNLKLQPKFEICPSVRWNEKTLRKRFYIADFSYQEVASKRLIVEDKKSTITAKNPVYTLKRQLFLIRYPEYIFKET